MAIVGALVATGIGADLSEKIGVQVCRISGGGNCGGDGNADAQGGGSNSPGNGDPASDRNPDGSQKSPAQIEYDKALKGLEDAKKDEKSNGDKALDAAKELAKILADELGITDALDCITKGDMGACTETLINVLLSLIGGAVGKLGAKYGAPWKWKKAYKLIKSLKKHGGDLYDGLKGLIKSRKKVKDAEKALENAGKKVDGEKKSPPKKDDKPDEKKPEKPNCPVKHSFPAGTPVLLADGRTVPIEAVRPGDLVTATDPSSGTTAARRVERAITTEDDKDFTRLTFRTLGGPAVITATDTHPFWITGERRWADAGDITPGMKLRTPDGSVLAVAGVSRYTQRQTTHDLTVSGIHTYYVVAGGTSVLVHNDDPCGMVSKPNALSQKTGYTVKQIKEAIHKVKNQGGWRGNGANRNPDMLIDPNTGEVYPQMPDGSPGDSIGNIFDHLPEEP
ncbi:Hint domain-containing protein [Streptomyces sp. NBC_01285]|uniref:Hint domain-containing protein n=1 Tax=Streptomyces sp. NBC_01285 TaxID=2903813 RepID=UPI00225937C8|nr:Hint domain-containing protein [Streptomyces sp. NBC_01285]MCX4770150.1 Hint domain-containing protein [Streptomyces sp. NBC_01285]